MVGEKTRTLFDDETDLLLAERDLIADYIRETSDIKNWNNNFKKFDDRAEILAESWKRYAMHPRQDGMAPKLKIAVKHGITLLNFKKHNINNIKKELSYGVVYGSENFPSLAVSSEAAERERLKIAAYPVPILDAPESGIFAVENFAKGTCTVLSTSTLEIIASCGKCPATGLCEISSRCTSYKAEEYRDARAKKGIEPESKEPTVEDYKIFNELNISRKKS